MYKLEDIRDVHLELTSKCQARCPMCPRRINGGPMNPLFDLTEIDLATFKSWFSPEFIQQLNKLFMCGNLGDPIIAEDCLEIFQYLRETNPNMQLTMHTNGSARNVNWWQELAKLKVKVTFGIDGLEDTHKLYRVSTDWHKIIKNAWSFIEAGGEAEWHMLVFKHNEHQVEECRAMAEELKFKNFQVKHTSRFVEDKLHVLDDTGRTTHILYPTETSKAMVSKVKDNINSTKINCKAVQHKQMYIAADGTVSPCCWLDFSWQLPNQASRVDYMDAVGLFPNLHKDSLATIFSSGYFQQIEDTWAHKPLLECSRQCGKFDKLGAQFEN
jgi:MoaA/NifB/PqqE/SkfB family radical SAM enzyme